MPPTHSLHGTSSAPRIDRAASKLLWALCVTLIPIGLLLLIDPSFVDDSPTFRPGYALGPLGFVVARELGACLLALSMLIGSAASSSDSRQRRHTCVALGVFCLAVLLLRTLDAVGFLAESPAYRQPAAIGEIALFVPLGAVFAYLGLRR